MSFLAADGRRGDQVVTPWIEVYVSAYGGGLDVVYRWARHDVADTYAGSGERKDGRIEAFGRVRRALSDREGQYEASTFSWSVTDLDALVATALESTNNRWLWQRGVELKLLGSAKRAAAQPPVVLARGLVTSANPSGPRTYRFDAEDVVSAEFGALSLEATVPRRTITTALFADASPDVLGLPQPIIYGEVSDAADTTPTGAVPTIPVGTEVISAVTWTRLLVASHACKAISEVYVDGVAATARYGVDVLAPGKAGWPFGTSYRDIGGQRFTLLYVKDAALTALTEGGTVTCNVQGIETVGDGSGSLITLVAYQYEHALINFVFQHYLTGAWLARPPLINIVLTPSTYKVHPTAFGDLGAVHLDRRPGVAYPGAGILGLYEPVTVRDLIASFNRSCDCECGFDAAGQFFVTAEPVITPTPTVTHTQELDVLRDSFTYEHDVEGLVNELPCVYRRAYTDAKTSEGLLAWHQGSIDAYLRTRRGTELVLDWIRDEQTALDIAQYWLLRRKDPVRRVRWRTSLHGLALELGQVIGLTHAFGTGAGGWTNRPIRLTELEVDVDALTVDLAGRDLGAAVTAGSVSFGAYATRTDARSLSVAAGGTVVVTPGTSSTVVQGASLGGSRRQGVRSASDANVEEYLDVRVDWDAAPAGYQGYADVDAFTRAVGTSATPTVYDVTTPGSPVFVVGGSATTALPTAPNRQTLVIARSAGVKWYRLRVRGSNVNAAVHALGALRLGP